MKTVDRWLQTERGLIKIEKEFKDRIEAAENGYGEAFTAHCGGYHLIFDKPESETIHNFAEVMER